MIDTIIFYTGVLTWIAIIAFVFPIIPFFGLALVGRAFKEILLLHEARYIPNDLSQYQRVQVHHELVERGKWNRTTANVLMRAKWGAWDAMDVYEERLLDPYYAFITRGR